MVLMNSINAIGKIHSPYKEKFGVPRQSGLSSAHSKIELYGSAAQIDRLRGLEEFSHLWVIFLFHLIDEQKANDQILVRPPRLGGKEKMGIFATRSPHRPNRLGLSAVKIISIDKNFITIEGGDFVDQTPVIDIKPYVEGDRILDARFGWSERAAKMTGYHLPFNVQFALSSNTELEDSVKDQLRELLKLDPRPAYDLKTSPDQKNHIEYKVFLLDYNVTFIIDDDKKDLLITHIEKALQ